MLLVSLMAISYLRIPLLHQYVAGDLCLPSKRKLLLLLHFWNAAYAFSYTTFRPTGNPNGNPNPTREEALLILLRKCANVRDLDQLHGQIIQLGFNQNLFVVGKALELCSVSDAGHNLMGYAEKMFKQVECPDGFLWNTMIRGFGNACEPEKAYEYYSRMKQNEERPDSFTFSFLLKICGQIGSIKLGKQVHSNVFKYGLVTHAFVGNTLIHMYGMLREIEAARQAFEEMPNKDLVSWNSIIDCHAHSGLHEEAVKLYMDMIKHGIAPDEATLVIILTCCSALGALDLGRQVHIFIENTTLGQIVSVCNALMDMYAKCGALEEAYRLFNWMKQRNIISWNTIILGLAAHGRPGDALDLFKKMLEEKIETPDELTFLGVICACSHGGLIEEGRSFFESMIRDYNIQPTVKHYGCMVDLFGRAGLLKEAYSLVENRMPVRGNSIVWRALLSACRVHGNLELAQKVRRRLSALENHSSDYVLLANIYGSSGQWNEVTRERILMRDGVIHKPVPANSCLAVQPRTITEL